MKIALEFSPYYVAQICALLGNKQEALQYLKIALDRHDESLIGFDGDLTLSRLHDDPAFRDLVARIGQHVQN